MHSEKTYSLQGSTLQEVLSYTTGQNHRFAGWAREQGIAFEGATSHVKQLMLSLLVISQCGPDMREPKSVLVYETGFNVGCSASAICEALEITGGKLVSFENDEKKKPVAAKFAERFPKVEFVWGDSAQTLPSLLERDRGKVDLFHQDGAHNLVGTRRDIELALLFLRPGGILVVDDSDTEVVKIAVSETIGDAKGIWLPHQTGQFIYQKG